MNSVSIHKALEFINTREGKIFSIKFTKRTTGETRTMICRQGVTKDLAINPIRPPMNFKAHALIPVYDMQKEAYRSIPIEGITEIKMEGVWHSVKFDGA